MPQILSRNDRVEAELRPSRAASLFILAGTIATVTIALAVPMPASIRFWLVLLIGSMALRTYRHEARRTSDAVMVLRLDATGVIDVVDGRGTLLCGSARAGSFVASWLTVMRWRPDGRRFDRTILVLPDMLPAEAFRRLRVLLRWGSRDDGNRGQAPYR